MRSAAFCAIMRAMNRQRLSLDTLIGQLAALGTVFVCVPVFAGTPQARSTAALQQVIGSAACDTDDQCRTVAIGNRACGGPEAYLAWSTRQTDPAELQEAVARYNATQAAAKLPGGRVSTCEFLSDPGAVCVPAAAVPAAAATNTAANRCQLRPRHGPAAQPSR